MIPTEFDYKVASTVEEALRLLEEHGDDAKLLAGGHSLIPLMKLRLAVPKVVVDIGRIERLRGIRAVGDHIEIGALTTHAEVAASGLLAHECPLLQETAREIGDVQVRNRGTIGGSLAHSDPAADYPAAILALDAEMVAESKQGSRAIPASTFFQDTFQTALHQGEVLTSIRVARHPAHGGSAYVKVHHPASGYAVVGVAVDLTVEGGLIHKARIGVTGVASKPYRAAGVERELEGEHPDAAMLRAAASHATDGLSDGDALGDVYCSGEYRAELARVHTRRAIELALSRTKS